MINEKREEHFDILNNILCDLSDLSIELYKDQKENDIDTKDIRKGLQLAIDVLVDMMFELRSNKVND